MGAFANLLSLGRKFLWLTPEVFNELLCHVSIFIWAYIGKIFNPLHYMDGPLYYTSP